MGGSGAVSAGGSGAVSTGGIIGTGNSGPEYAGVEIQCGHFLIVSLQHDTGLAVSACAARG
jgi:hypothetical protein